MSAAPIIDTAPLGALIRYTDGSPKPSARFTRKLAVGKRSNGVEDGRRAGGADLAA